MKAYCIVYERRLHDPKMFDEYRKQVLPTIEAYGGKFLVRGGTFTVLEGEMPFERIAMLELPSRKAAEDSVRFSRLSEDPAAPAQRHRRPVHRSGRRRLGLHVVDEPRRSSR